MAEKTTNLELTKPGLGDGIDVSVLNENFDIIDAAVAGKVDKVEGMGLSENSFTDAEKQKLASLENYDDSEMQALISTLTETIASLEARIAELESTNEGGDT